jgi:glyoxylase-like metal-dependent hydrolase (beta-lactamase superfamily II)
MRVRVVNTGYFKLDGGAMFGIVPKMIWNNLNPADESNLCTWSMRALYIESGDRKILVDTGIGKNHNAKFLSYFHPTEVIDFSVFSEEITDLFLTHLHFDHCGGAIENNQLVFKNAISWTNEIHLESAKNPNPKEKNSFLAEKFTSLPFRFLPVQRDDFTWYEGIEVRYNYGHTTAMMLLIIHSSPFPIIYCADTIPSSAHIQLPYVMSYDILPLITIEEKNRILEEALERNALIVFEHDPKYAACSLQRLSNGRIGPLEFFTQEAFNSLYSQ